jgi:hypothetical protein
MRKVVTSWLRLGPHELQPTSRLKPGRDVLSTEHEGAMVLLDLRRQVYLGVDEVGTSIWQEIERGSTYEQIERSLEAQYDAPPDVLRREARVFIEELIARRLVVVS